MMIKMKAEH